MSAVLAERPGTVPYRNDLPVRFYVYRGTVQDEPEPESEPCECGGDMRGYRKHLDRKEKPCQASRDDANLYHRNRTSAGRRKSKPAKVHLDRGTGKPRCGRGARVTADKAGVSCETCLGIDAGTHNQGRPGPEVRPCGTAAAYRRHLRKKEPVDEACRLAANQDRNDWGRARDQRTCPDCQYRLTSQNHKSLCGEQ